MSNTIPLRNEVPESDKWDLSAIYKSEEDWEKALKQVPILSKKVVSFKGRLGESKEKSLCKPFDSSRPGRF